MAAGIGTGTTLAFGTLTGGMTNISHSGSSRPVILLPHMGTTVTVPKVPGALTNWGSVTADILFDPDTDLATWLAEHVKDPDDLIITFPGGTIFTAGSAFIAGEDLFGVPVEDAMTASITFELNTLPVITGP